MMEDFEQSEAKVIVPPIKCQGIKTKIVPSIKENVVDADGRWIEPFLGSGVVLFNVAPKRAIVSDINCHIINFYKSVQKGSITPAVVRNYLNEQGDELSKRGEEYYYEVRNRFNKNAEPLDFLFLNRSCFNGIIRFNKKGGFNVPFCKKSWRFTKSYVTKIVNQVEKISSIMKGKDWVFDCCDWKKTLAKVRLGDFVYLDPPYIGRHTDYFGCWSEKDAQELATCASGLMCPFILSMWSRNRYRINTHLDASWSAYPMKTIKHFYHVGPKESLRNEMEEAIVLGNF